MTIWQTITWDTARAGGFMAYGLITISIALGLALSLRWYSKPWPRWATADVHEFVTLLALTFVGIHTLAIFLDPYMRFTPAEVLVPLATHYRPIWVALGIVAAYLMAAVWISGQFQKQIGYRWWRRLHYATFGIWGLATVHGIASGSDTRSLTGALVYGGSVLLVGTLLSIRLLGTGKEAAPHPNLAYGAAAIFAVGLLWAVTGPLRPGWNSIANNGNGSGARTAQSGGQAVASNGLSLPFTAQLQGSATQTGSGNGLTTVRMNTTLSGGGAGRLTIVLQGQSDGAGGLQIESSQVSLQPGGSSGACTGQIVSVDQRQLIAQCIGAGGTRVQLDIAAQTDRSGSVSGTVQASAA